MQMLPLLSLGMMMMNKPKSPAPPPKPEPTSTAPTRNAANVRQAGEEAVRRRSAAQGRASTNLTGNVSADSGSPAFSNTVLGQ